MKTLATKLPDEVAAQFERLCTERGITPSEALRALVLEILGGTSELSGPDKGYAQAKRLASQIASLALMKAIAGLPGSYEEALAELSEWQKG